MSGADPRGWLDRLVGSALGLLVAGLAIYWAVHLILAVLVPLLLIIGVIVVGSIVFVVIRSRQRW